MRLTVGLVGEPSSVLVSEDVFDEGFGSGFSSGTLCESVGTDTASDDLSIVCEFSEDCELSEDCVLSEDCLFSEELDVEVVPLTIIV